MAGTRKNACAEKGKIFTREVAGEKAKRSGTF